MTVTDILGHLTQMRVADLLGYIAAVLVFLTFSMKTMVPLRLTGIASNVFFIAYGYLNPAYPLLILHLALLPLNILRLNQMLALVRQVEAATGGDLNMNWIKPFTSTRTMSPGDVIFRKGDEAKEMIFVMSGSLKIPELGVSILPGDVVGELALLSPEKARTQSLVTVDAGELLVITYDQVKQLFIQNPRFGYYFLQLSARRLFDNITRLERDLEAAREPLTRSP